MMSVKKLQEIYKRAICLCPKAEVEKAFDEIVFAAFGARGGSRRKIASSLPGGTGNAAL